MTEQNNKNKIKKIRIDELLVKNSLVSDIELARKMIMAYEVISNDNLVKNPSEKVPQNSSIRFKNQKKYVSRGGNKLEGAILNLNLDPTTIFKDKTILDIGASTGGFSDYSLQHGAKLVISLDVGTNQLSWKLRNHPRIIPIDQTNIKDFSKQLVIDKISKLNRKDDSIYPKSIKDLNIDWVLADISFNSLSKLASYIIEKSEANNYLLLIKPQFELPQEDIPEGGVIKDESLRQKALSMVIESFKKQGFTKFKNIDSPVSGKYGNVEIFLYVHK